MMAPSLSMSAEQHEPSPARCLRSGLTAKAQDGPTILQQRSQLVNVQIADLLGRANIIAFSSSESPS